MNTKNDGGPFFPKHLRERKIDPYTPEELAAAAGISLRDWFAGMALQGLLAGGHTKNSIFTGWNEDEVKRVKVNGKMEEVFGEFRRDLNPEECAQFAGAFADAMIAERNKP